VGEAVICESARRHAVRSFAAAVLLLGCAPSIAQAAQRFAAPSAQGSGDCSSAADACTLEKAFEGAATGDDLILAGDAGTYGTQATPISTMLTQPSGVYTLDVHGAAGQPRPVLYSSATVGMQLLGSFNGQGFSVSDLDIEHLAGGSGLFVSGTVDHVLVHSTANSDFVCNLVGLAGTSVSMIDSECIADGSSDYALFQQNNGPVSEPIAVTLRNDTFEAAGAGSLGMSVSASNGATASVSGTNLIAHGSYKDIDTYESSGGTLALTLNHSNYATTLAESGTSITPAGTATNQSAAPVFVDAAADNFHEAPGSPTIDTGITEAANGTTDLDGNPRSAGGLTDIGAFQASEPLPVSVVAPSGQGTPSPPLAPPALLPPPAPLPPGFLSLHTSTATVTGADAPVTLTCSVSSAGCRGTLLLSERVQITKKIEIHAHGKTHTRLLRATITRTIGAVSFSLGAGQTTTLKVPLSHPALTQLAHAKHHRLTVAVVARRGDAGPALSAKITLTLPASKPHRRPRR